MLRTHLRLCLYAFLLLLWTWVGLGGLRGLAQGTKVTYTSSTLATDFQSAESIAVDSAGDLYVVDLNDRALYKETPNGNGSYARSQINVGSGQPIGVAVDTQNNLYVANGLGVVKETYSTGSYTETTVVSGLANVYGVAVDGNGNVYVVANGSGTVYKESPSGSNYTQSVVVSGLSSPSGGIAVDGSGIIYVADTGNAQVLKELPSGSSYTQNVVVSAATVSGQPAGVAVDALGDVFISYLNKGTYRATPVSGSSYFVFLISTASGAGLATDSQSAVYVAEPGEVDKLTPIELAVDSGSVNFGSHALRSDGGTQTVTFTFAVASTLASAPYAVSTQGNLQADFQAAATQPSNVCVGSHTYAVGDTCSVSASFSPTRPGVRYGAVAVFQSSGAPIGTAYLQGSGVGPQVSFSPGFLPSLSISGLGVEASPFISDDGQGGMLFIGQGAGFLDIDHDLHTGYYIVPLLSAGYTSQYFSDSTFYGAFGGVDGAGNILQKAIGQIGSQNDSVEIDALVFNPNLPLAAPSTTLPGKSTRYGLTFITRIPNDASNPVSSHIAIDGSGNVYFADYSNHRVLKETRAYGGYNQETVIDSNLKNPGDVVVDSSGNVFVLDAGNNRVVKETLVDGYYEPSTVLDNLASPQALAIDRLGNLYITLQQQVVQQYPSILKETLVAGSYVTSSLNAKGNQGVDVDAAGNVLFVANNFVQQLDVSDPPSLRFATTAVGAKSTDSPQTVTLTNNGNGDLTFSLPASGLNPTITAGFTLDPSSTCPVLGPSATSVTLPAGQSCKLAVNFVPTQGGAIHGTLTVTDNDRNAEGSTQVIQLNGQATGNAAISATLTPPTQDFGTQAAGTQSPSQTFTLTNNGSVALNIQSVSFLNEQVPNFVGVGGTCPIPTGPPVTKSSVSRVAPADTVSPAPLPPGSSCTLVVAFTPQVAGPLTATLIVADDAGQQSSTLTGIGTAAAAPKATLNPSSASFGNVNVGSTSFSQTFTLTNAGNAALPITSISLGGANPGSFAVGANTCGASLAASASCTIAVTFSPASAASFSATLAVVDSVGTQTAALTGAGVPPTAPQAALTPAAANFGSVNVGSTGAAQVFTLTNAGNAPLPITSVGIGGTSAAAFALGTNTCGTTLAAGASCAVSISFKAAVPGAAAATLSIVDSVGTQSSALTATGMAVVPPDFTLTGTPSSQTGVRGTAVSFTLQLGSVDPNNPFTQSVALTAAGLSAGATVTFSPPSVVPGSASPVPSTMTVTVPALTARLDHSERSRTVLAGLSIGSLLLCCGWTGRRRRPFSLVLLALLTLGAVTTTLTGCGTDNGFALPSSTSTITVTGTSGATTHSAILTLTEK